MREREQTGSLVCVRYPRAKAQGVKVVGHRGTTSCRIRARWRTISFFLPGLTEKVFDGNGIISHSIKNCVEYRFDRKSKGGRFSTAQ